MSHKKGLNIINEIENIAKCKEVSPDKLVAGVKEMYMPIKMNPKRTAFMADAQKLMGTELLKKYYPITIKVKIDTFIRNMFLVTGTYRIMKKCLNRMRGR